jgi:hypothetical protein
MISHILSEPKSESDETSSKELLSDEEQKLEEEKSFSLKIKSERRPAFVFKMVSRSKRTQTKPYLAH